MTPEALSFCDKTNMLTVTEAHRLLGESWHEIQLLCQQGDVPGAVLHGKNYYIPMEWIKNRRKELNSKNYEQQEHYSHNQVRQHKWGRRDGNLSLRQVAVILGIHQQTVTDIIKNGYLNYSNGSGITPEALGQYFALRERTTRNNNSIFSAGNAAQMLNIANKIIYTAIEAGKIICFKDEKIDLDDLEPLLVENGYFTTKEAAKGAQLPRVVIYLALVTKQISYNNGKGIKADEVAAFVANSPGLIQESMTGCLDKADLFTCAEAARMASVTKTAISYAIKNGKIKKYGNYITREEVEKYIQTRRKYRTFRKNKQSDNGLLLTCAEAAKLAGVPVTNIWRAVSLGRLRVDDDADGISRENLKLYICQRKSRKLGYLGEDTLTVTKAASIADVSKKTIYNAIHVGEIKIDVSGGITICELKKYIKNRNGVDVKIPTATEAISLDFNY